nr:HepT-like ribonuclease domain-containing protein [Thioalkalivibrio sp.]
MIPDRATDHVYVEHMLDCIARVEEYTQLQRDRFFGSRLIQDAVVRNLQVMAESSQRLSQEAKSVEAKIPWRAIAGFRNIVLHDYLGLDMETIWTVVEVELPPLRAALERLRE